MIPVFVLTGYLGSGKTTLLSRLLRRPDMSRTAVIVNEFGEIGIDHDLIETSDESFVQLSNGCLCCTVRSDLVLTLGDLAARRAAGTVPPFDRVVIETTGLADPAPILHALMTDRAVNEAYTLAAVVTTVDGIVGLATLDAHEECRRQVALADRIVITKTDVAEAQLEAVRERVAAMNPEAEIGSSASFVIPDRAPRGAIRNPYGSLIAWLAPSGTTPQKGHLSDIQTFCIVRDEPLHAVTLALFLSGLAENCGPDLLRMKGIVNVREEPERPAGIHGVQHVYHAPVWLDQWPSDDRRTRMVFIGRGLHEGWTRNLLELLESEVMEEANKMETVAV